MKKAKIIAVAAAALMAFVSCGSSSSSSEAEKTSSNNMLAVPDSDKNISSEDMPAGASTILMTQDTTGVPVQIEYIDGQINEDEGKLLAKYFNAISTKDGTAMGECFYEPYMKSVLEEEELSDAQGLVDQSYDVIKTYVNEDFELNYLIIQQNVAGYDFSSFETMLAKSAPDANITSRKLLLVDVYGKTPTNSGMSLFVRMGETDYYPVCIYQIDGKFYIM